MSPSIQRCLAHLLLWGLYDSWTCLEYTHTGSSPWLHGVSRKVRSEDHWGVRGTQTQSSYPSVMTSNQTNFTFQACLLIWSVALIPESWALSNALQAPSIKCHYMFTTLKLTFYLGGVIHDEKYTDSCQVRKHLVAIGGNMAKPDHRLENFSIFTAHLWVCLVWNQSQGRWHGEKTEATIPGEVTPRMSIAFPVGEWCKVRVSRWTVSC